MIVLLRRAIGAASSLAWLDEEIERYRVGGPSPYPAVSRTGVTRWTSRNHGNLIRGVPGARAVQKLEAVCAAHGVRLASAALQFVLAHPSVVSAVLGLRSREEVAAAMEGYRESIGDRFWSDLKGEGLIAADAPTPAEPRRMPRSN